MSYSQTASEALGEKRSGIISQANQIADFVRRVNMTRERIRKATVQIYGPTPQAESTPRDSISPIADNISFAINQLSDAVNGLEHDVNLLHNNDR